MAALPDEILMAYADGALDQETRTRVDALLYQDADARRRLEIFRVTGAISEVFEPVMEEPVPEWLINYVHDFNAPRPAPVKPWMRILSVPRAWRVPQIGAVSWQLAAAFTMVLVGGSGLGWVVRGELAPSPDQQELAALNQGQIFAKGSLAQILDSVPSNREARVGGWLQDSTIMRVNLTFKNKAGGYCREYEMAVPTAGNFAGLACRNAAGQWAIQVHIGEGGRSFEKATMPAGRARTLDPIIDRMMDGDALGKTEEDAVIEKSWQ